VERLSESRFWTVGEWALLSSVAALAVVAGMACSEVPFAVGWAGRGLCAVEDGVDGIFALDESTTGEASLAPGTSRLCRKGLLSLVTTGLLVWMGNRVSGPPLERSRR